MKFLRRALQFASGGGWYDDVCTCNWVQDARPWRAEDPNCAVHGRRSE